MNGAPYFLAFLFVLTCLPATVLGQESGNTEAAAAVQEKLNAQVDLSTTFTDEKGREVSIRETMLPQRPALLVPVYYNCPYICSISLAGTARVIDEAGLELGKDYSIITLSFDPSEDSKVASSAADRFRAGLREETARNAWHFLTGKKESIDRITDDIGFRYQKENGEYVHGAMFVILTPEGRVSRYAYGVSLDPRNFRYALIEASKGEVGNALDQIFLYCFHFDEISGKYTPIIWNITRIFGFATFGAVALLVVLLLRRSNRNLSKSLQ